MARVLVVCTANVCRSPMAAALLEAFLSDDGPTTIASAGIRATPGHPAAPPMQSIARRWGLDLADHRAAPLTASDVDAADLVLTMERRQRAEIARLAPTSVTRTFTLPELASLAARLETDPASFTDVEQLVGALDRLRSSVPTDVADVADPVGGRRSAYRATARELRQLTQQVAAVLGEVGQTTSEDGR